MEEEKKLSKKNPKNLEWMKTELQEMRGGFAIKAQLLKKKLKTFELNMMNQYMDLQEKLEFQIQKFQGDHETQEGFYVAENDQSSIQRFDRLKDLFVRWNDDSRKIFFKLHKLEVSV